ncbi:MAG TPA: sulfate ABC transporter permease subunit CysT [Alphaproteobacteria bacterium]|jgi:sulfate transport system permease protein
MSLVVPARSSRRRSVIPGFGITLGLTITWLSLIVLIPLASLFIKSATLDFGQIVDVLLSPRTISAFRVSFGLSLAAASINVVFGVIVAWILVRYEFPFKRVADAIVDIPFALPTAVAGIALTALYAPNGWIGSFFAKFGIKIAYTPLGILVALVFIGLPFVVRTVQPVLEDMEKEMEEAATSLGATRWQVVTRVIFPTIFPALATGFALAFARAVGEYGSVIFIAGNIPLVSEIAPLLIIIKLSEYAYAQAMTIAAAMLVISFILLLIINILQRWSARYAR